tara:strand:- start:2914 stop:3423 length:510 start_codon:yes stop_codon:yes gene_type:complete
VQNTNDFRTAVNKLNKLLLETAKPQEEVKEFNTGRATEIVHLLQNIDSATGNLITAVNQQKRGLQKELRVHKRLVEKLFSNALPNKKHNTEYARHGLKAWMVKYAKQWRDKQWEGKVKTEEELRKGCNEYNTKTFSARLPALLNANVLSKDVAGSYKFNRLADEVLAHG